MRIGVLSLQGDYEKHAEKLKELGANTLYIKKPQELDSISALVIPGGESTTLLKLTDPEFRLKLKTVIKDGLPTFATCAGLILLAEKVANPPQESLSVLEAEVTRNAYGRQVDSFIEPQLEWSAAGLKLLSLLNIRNDRINNTEGVFIRAPKITKTSPKIEILISHKASPVLVKQDNIIGATFHPELANELSPIYDLFLSLLK